MKWEKSVKRSTEVKNRASRPDHMYSYCRIPGCGKPARAGTSDGLDTRYCRSHYDHYQRHGSPTKTSYTARQLNPYRQAAMAWLVEHPEEFWVKDAIGRIKGLYRRAGQHIEAFRLRGLSPRARANAHWARLRRYGVDPRLPVAAWLAVEMLVQDDPHRESGKEFGKVQAAKLVHRMASGTHKSWERERPNPMDSRLPPITVKDEAHWYPKSRGKVLRHIGEDLEKAVELLADHHLEEVRAYKEERDQIGAFDWSPYPKGITARKREQ